MILLDPHELVKRNACFDQINTYERTAPFSNIITRDWWMTHFNRFDLLWILEHLIVNRVETRRAIDTRSAPILRRLHDLAVCLVGTAIFSGSLTPKQRDLLNDRRCQYWRSRRIIAREIYKAFSQQDNLPPLT